MPGILALLAFGLAFVFHGAGFTGLGPWLDWQGLALLGFVLLAIPVLPAFHLRPAGA